LALGELFKDTSTVVTGDPEGSGKGYKREDGRDSDEGMSDTESRLGKRSQSEFMGRKSSSFKIGCDHGENVAKFSRLNLFDS
jgi:hypothetical protein